MTEKTRSNTGTDPSFPPGQPPGGGCQDHDSMRAAAMQPVDGPASTDTLAAGGGLDLPGRERNQVDVPTVAPLHEPIPGERDPSNLTHREAGAVSGQFAGADTPSPDPHDWLDEVTAREHVREGGGQG